MTAADLTWFRAESERFSGELKWDEPLSRHTYYRIGGPASLVAVPRSLDDLRWLREGLEMTGAAFCVLGAGSNVLVADEGFPGVIIKASRINLEITAQDTLVMTGASVAISTFLRRASQEGWGGLELLTGIPGSVGGAVIMNAGTHLGETKDRLRKIEIFDFAGTKAQAAASREDLTSIDATEFRYAYRKNDFIPRSAIVWSAQWEITPQTPADVKARIDEILARRKATQPLEAPSCGSVFKNPRESGMQAWQVVDQLGLRGHRIGDAQVSEKHSNWILNLGTAKAADVRALISLIQARSRAELGIELEAEVLELTAAHSWL